MSSVPYFLPYQRDWIDDDSQFAVAEKSRRIGFSYAEAYRSVERRVKLGTDHYFASRDRDTARDFIEYCDAYVRVFGAVAENMGEEIIDEEHGILAFVIRFENGAKIAALTSNPHAVRGKGGDITFDEYAFHKAQREVLKAGNASARVWSHQIRVISTHNGDGTTFNRVIIEIRQGKRKGRVHTVTLQDAVDQGFAEVVRASKAATEEERRRIIANPDMDYRRQFIDDIRDSCLDESEWEEEYCCIPSSDEKAYLSYQLIDQCVERDPLALPLADDVIDLLSVCSEKPNLFAGYDVGRRHDLSVLWVIELLGDVAYTRAIIELDKQTFSTQKSMLRSLMHISRVHRLCIDETGLGMMLAEELADEFGDRVEPVTMTATWKSTAAPYLRRAFEDRAIRIPDNDALRGDLHKTRKSTTAAGNVRLLASSDDAGHADRFWAGVLAYEAMHEPEAAPEAVDIG